MNAKYYANTTDMYHIAHLKYWVCWGCVMNISDTYWHWMKISQYYRQFLFSCGVLQIRILFLTVLTNYLSVRVQGEPVLKYNTAVLRCQVPQSAASYTKIISWTRGSTRLYPSTRGGNMTLIGLFCGLCAAFF